MWLTHRQRRRLLAADQVHRGYPIPTRMITNGEFMPIAQTPAQREVEAAIETFSAEHAARNKIDRRRFLSSAAGMATAFLALNHVFGDFFAASRAEASDLDAAAEARARLSDQMIVDVQLHFVRDDYAWNGILALGDYAKRWNPVLKREGVTFERFKFENFIKEVYFDSDTKIGLISAAPADHGDNVIMNNDGLAATRKAVNAGAGSRRMLCHSVIAPGQPGWMDALERAIAVHKPDGFKGYTLGDPFESSAYPWRLDDEKLMYPAYERMQKAGIRNICIHKGLLPDDYKKVFAHWQHAKVDDVGKAARDWPGLNFIIYHSGFRPLMTSPAPLLRQFKKTGRIDWVTDLAEIPATYGVKNVYAELGTTFGSCTVTHPELAAVILGQLIQGLGADHVLWGTDSVWYGSPQWQIEALRRIEIPYRLQKTHGFAPLGAADGPVKQAIFSGNAVRLFKLEAETGPDATWRGDHLSRARADYLAAGGTPSNTFYGFIRALKGERA